MAQHRLNPGVLLDENGALCEAGYATSLVKQYKRSDIKANGLRIKEWDYYLIYNRDFGVALTLDDNSYMGMISATFLDFSQPFERTVSPMFWFPMGKTCFPSSSAKGDIEKRMKNANAAFTHEDGKRHLVLQINDFNGGKPLSVDIVLTEEPPESMVIATPFPNKTTAFYYNQKIIGMRAEGFVEYKGKKYCFEPETSFGMLDWGRGVWTYNNTWYWSAAQGVIDGHVFGFNLGYGFGDTSAASENMLFYDGKAHKLENVSFGIPQKDGKDDFLSPWHFTSSDGRFEAEFCPIIDRKSDTNVLVIESDQHQVFGLFNGKAVLDDGTELVLKDFLGFAEKVKNRW